MGASMYLVEVEDSRALLAILGKGMKIRLVAATKNELTTIVVEAAAAGSAVRIIPLELAAPNPGNRTPAPAPREPPPQEREEGGVSRSSARQQRKGGEEPQQPAPEPQQSPPAAEPLPPQEEFGEEEEPDLEQLLKMKDKVFSRRVIS